MDTKQQPIDVSDPKTQLPPPLLNQLVVLGLGLLRSPLAEVVVLAVDGDAGLVASVASHLGWTVRKTWHGSTFQGLGPFAGPFAPTWNTTPPNVGGMQSLL